MPVAELTLDALRDWGRAFGAALQPPAVVALSGELGAGKTTLVQAIAEGLGIREPVTSPTYALVHEYAAPRGSVHHFDLYRLRDEAQLPQLGWDEAIAGGGIVLVEWPEHAGHSLPETAQRLALAHVAGREDLRALRVGGSDA
ncbi:MAG TPA: tRNA (adenosine(37)-N6)-threonylcarbamoyltransferase complex ATPase subunit type 1 TsaE [Gemmatimonadaceae bacterium]|nr:tRNA (adenosine(37)-N6)-threonylcarbamoyltransferase complex ATPase subunit type 1 TsaE [Gemmatimonadaceae bacterium]